MATPVSITGVLEFAEGAAAVTEKDATARLVKVAMPPMIAVRVSP